MTSAADYLKRIEAALHALSADRPDEAMAAITAIAGPMHEASSRRSVTRSIVVEIFRRDRFTCRYCGNRVVPPPILRLLASIFPVQFPYHPNWKTGRTHPAIPLLAAEVDHLVAGTRLGAWSDPTNLVTSCHQCNSRKADFTPQEVGLHLRAIEETDWDGLTGLYRVVWEKAGKPEPEFHRPWLQAYS